MRSRFAGGRSFVSCRSLEILEGLLVRIVDGKNGDEAGDIEDFPDWLGERAQRDPPLRAVEALGRAEEHAQPSAADVLQPGQIDHDPALAGVDVSENSILER